jgi:hypothetical protein
LQTPQKLKGKVDCKHGGLQTEGNGGLQTPQKLKEMVDCKHLRKLRKWWIANTSETRGNGGLQTPQKVKEMVDCKHIRN